MRSRQRRREEQLAVGAVEVDLGFEHPGEGRWDGDDAAGVGLAVVGLRPLEDLALVGGTADLERLAVEVLAAQGQHLPQPQTAVGEDADHCLVATSRLGEAVHLLETEDADRPRLLPRSRVVGSDADALEGVEVADFVRDRVLGHCREGAKDADGSRSCSTFGPEHVVDQGERVTAAQLAQGPVLQRDALDLYVGNAADAVIVRCVGAFGAWVALGPGRGVVAESVRAVGEAVCLVDGFLRVAFPGEGSFASVPGRLCDVPLAVPPRVPRNPYDLPRRVAALDRRVASHDASSRCLARKSSTSAGSIRRAAPSL